MASSVLLVHPAAQSSIPIRQAMAKCRLFERNPGLIVSPYTVRSSVPVATFHQFVSALEGLPVDITSANFAALFQLSDEFGFEDFAAKLSDFPGAIEANLRGRIIQLEEKNHHHDRAIALLRRKFSELADERQNLVSEGCTPGVEQRSIEELSADVSALKAQISRLQRDPIGQQLSIEVKELSAQVSSLKGQIERGWSDPIVEELSGEVQELFTEVSSINMQLLQGLRDPVAQQLSIEVRELQREVAALKTQMTQSVGASVSQEISRELSADVSSLKMQMAQVLREPIAEQVRREMRELQREVSALKTQVRATTTPVPAGASIDSRIISSFPEIFGEFRGKRFEILWRGSRDGFRAAEFHRRCDRHANTLTVILDTNGNIFGGFTPVEWESQVWNGKDGDESNCRKADPTVKSFLFTLKNPHNFPAKRFPLKTAKKQRAIVCDSTWGPRFFDIAISDNCNANTESNACFFGFSYADDSGFERGTLLTGSASFRVKEIEVFEITG
jgi:archaellum component FlaC